MNATGEKSAAGIYLSELLSKEEIRRFLNRTGAGLELIRFSISENLDHFSDTMHDVREELKGYGDPKLTLHGPFLDLNPMSYDSRIRQVTMDRFNQAYEAAYELGAKKIVYHSGMIPSVCYLEGWAERMVEFWKEFLEEKTGITVCMENVLDREIYPFRMVADQVNDPCFGICLDLGHAHCYAARQASEWILELKEQICHVHVHDNDGRHDRHLGLGEGTMPWKELLQALRENSPKATYTIECGDYASAYTTWKALQEILQEA